MESQLENGKWQDFKNRLAKMYKHRSKTARRQQLDAYRIYDNDLASFPFTIDMYGEAVYVAEYARRHGMDEETHDIWLSEAVSDIAEVLGCEEDAIFVKERKRMSHRSDQQYKCLSSVKEFFVVKENGLSFQVNLTDYLDSGLFLDHRITREWVRKESEGKKVLNLFSYTCAFSVYAAAGGATEVVSVDLSNTYLNWGKENFKLNGLDLDETHFPFVQADVMSHLSTFAKDSFDIIVLDPPTFSNSKRMVDILDIQRDHADLINEALYCLKPGGKLYFSTNFKKFSIDAESIKTDKIKDITKATTSFDFEGKLFRWCYLIEK